MTEESKRWAIPLVLGVIPVVNFFTVIAYALVLPIETMINPLEEMYGIKNLLNQKVKCKQCGINSYMWTTVRSVTRLNEFERECTYCKANKKNFEYIDDKSVVVNGYELTLKEASIFYKTSSSERVIQKDSALLDEYELQLKLIETYKSAGGE